MVLWLKLYPIVSSRALPPIERALISPPPPPPPGPSERFLRSVEHVENSRACSCRKTATVLHRCCPTTPKTRVKDTALSFEHKTRNRQNTLPVLPLSHVPCRLYHRLDTGSGCANGSRLIIRPSHRRRRRTTRGRREGTSPPGMIRPRNSLL